MTRPLFSRRHFVWLADKIGQLPEPHRAMMTDFMITHLSREFPTFDQNRFREACNRRGERR